MLRMMNTTCAVNEGDIVRFELEDGGAWFYCRVRRLDDAGDLVCSVIEAQSWPDVALSGFLPGREYRMPAARVLSVVERAPKH